MITAFMVFKRIQVWKYVGLAPVPAEIEETGWKLYFTTTDRDMREEDIKHDADYYGWRVVKVTLDNEFNGTCEAL